MRPFALLLALGACASAPHAPAVHELVGTWQFLADVPPGARLPTLNVGSDGSISGNGGVNRFKGIIALPALAEGRWQVDLAATRMAGSGEAMALEQQVLDALARADRAVLAGERLELHRGDEPLGAFARLRW